MTRPAAAASPTKGKTYEAGHVTAATNVHFRVSKSGRSLTDISLELQMPCSNGRESFVLFTGASQSAPAHLRIVPDASFSGTFAVSQDMLDPFVASEQYWLSGTFTRHGKAARLTVRARQVGEGGTVCDSADRHVTAKRLASPNALR